MSKSGNLSNLGITEAKLSFLTFGVKEVFNYLWLAFIKALILWHFNLKCHIQIETDALSYVIREALSLLTSGINPNLVIIKTDLGNGI